jgi:hypothetical protein
MSTIEEWERHCAYCRQPITLKWKNGPMPSEAVCLVFDQVFHDKCWDKFRADHTGKRALPPAWARCPPPSKPVGPDKGAALPPPTRRLLLSPKAAHCPSALHLTLAR